VVGAAFWSIETTMARRMTSSFTACASREFSELRIDLS